jgi:hypothetical protein
MADDTNLPKPKKSVALSGTVAGNTAVCTVGRTGNDLHYRGYDILDFADKAEFEEIAHLLIHGTLPNAAQLKAYKAKLKSLRGLPQPVKQALEAIPADAHPMDVMRTGCSMLGTCEPEPEAHSESVAKEMIDRLLACFGSMLMYWHHYTTNGKRIEVETNDDSIGAHILHLLHETPPKASWVRAMHTSLILYAEHEFNASTFTARVIAGTNSDLYSCITGAIGALRGPKHGGANEEAFRIQERRRGRGRHPRARRAQGDRHRFRPPGLYHLRPAQRSDQAPGEITGRGKRRDAPVRHRRTSGKRDVGHQEDVPQPRLVLRGVVSHDGRADQYVHAAVRDLARHRLGRARDGTARRRQDHPPQRELCRAGESGLGSDRKTLKPWSTKNTKGTKKTQLKNS